MTLKLSTTYPGRASAPDADYPYSSFRNETVQGADDGTPLEIAWAKDVNGFEQSLLSEAKLTPNDEPDTVPVCQKMTAMKLLFGSTNRPPNASIQDLCAGFPGVQWHDPAASPNYAYLGASGAEVVDSCLAWSWTDDKPCVLYITDSGDVRSLLGQWDYDMAPALGGTLGLTYPATPSHVLSVANDGTSTYVAWRRDSDGNIMVSKYAMNPFSVTPVWTTDLGEVYPATADLLNYFKLIIAGDYHIALSMSDLVLSISAHGVAIINKSNGGFLLGQGNNTSYNTADDKAQFGKIVSDGTHVYWIGKSGTTSVTFYLASAKISAPTTSDYSLAVLATGIVAASEREKYFTGLLNVGGSEGAVVVSNPSGQVNVFSKLADAAGGCVEIQNFLQWDPNPDGYDIMIGSDGFNAFFFLYARYIPGAAQDDEPAVRVYSVPLSTFGRQRRLSSLYVWGEIHPMATSINWGGLESENKIGNMVFDGRDMWIVTRPGHVFRLTNTLGR